MSKTITIQGPNALEVILKDIPSTKTGSSEWLEYVAECIEKPTNHRLGLSWSAFNANKTGSPFEGIFVVVKTLRNFSSISIDHVHEQNNKLVKDDVGDIGLTEKTSELTCFMIWGPEIARIVNELEENIAGRRGSKAI